jgi:hypothetical protein
MNRTLPASLASIFLAVTLAGCMVHVDKDEKGEEKNVRVDTPFGHVHVTTNQTTAADLGLPVYPGAQQANDHDSHNSADINAGFGEWAIKVKAASYLSSDPRGKVIDFYKNALSRFGTVISCQDGKAAGKPEVTSEGLTCEADSSVSNVSIASGKQGKNFNVNTGKDGKGFQLKAGSKHHQHVVELEDSTDGKTHFTLLAVDLPSGFSAGDSSK